MYDTWTTVRKMKMYYRNNLVPTNMHTCIIVVDYNIGLIAFIVAFPIIRLIFLLIPIFKLLSELRSNLVLY